MKLIKLSDTHYIVVDDSEIKEGDFIYEIDQKNINVAGCDYSKNNKDFKITHSTQPLEGGTVIHGITHKQYLQIKYLDLSEVEEAINGYNVKNKAKYYYGNNRKTREFEEGFMLGFQIAHQELVKDKLFTIKDMEMLFAYAHTIGMNSVLQIQSPHLLPEQDIDKLRDEFIQLLLPKEWDIEFDEQGKIKLYGKD